MLGFLVGLVAGGAAMWMWRDRLEHMVHERPNVRAKLADQLGHLERTAEDAIDTAKERIKSSLRAGQEYLRAGETEEKQGSSEPAS